MTDYNNLKPCPFCGAKASHTETDNNQYYPWLIHCVGQCKVMPVARGETEEEVINNWNNRHADISPMPETAAPQAPAEEADTALTCEELAMQAQIYPKVFERKPADSTKEATQPSNFMQQGYRPEYNPLKQSKDI